MKRLRPASRAPSEEATGAARGSRDQTGNRWGLLPRIGLAVGGLAAGLVVVFAILIIATVGLRQRSLEARHAQQVIAAANGLQTLVIDFETGLRGFVITDQERYLSPWVAARRSYPKESADLLRLTKDEPQQHAAALRIKQLIDSYLQDYSVPFVAFVRRNPSIARVVAISQTGRERVEQIRSHFASFLSAEQALGAARDARARRTAHAAILAASIALAAALTFLIGAAAYLVRAVARPVRLAAAVAERVAAGDLTGRLPTEGPGEVGQLERSFNTMADSLQRNRDDLEERNRRLVESERLKTELVSNVSHELRTPLASVLGFSDLLLKRDVDPEDQRRYLEVIRTEAARLATLLNDLLDLQRHEQGVIELRREEFDLNQLLSVQVTLYSAQSNVHELAFDPADERLVVYGDPDRLAQVIGNLLSNAIKYSPDGGRIQVTTGVSEGEAWIWVRDPGLGIPSGHQHQVFTKFFRGEAARKRGIAGTGLGLVLARQIVEAHEGQIGFESEDRKGSTFWVRLPAVVDRSALAAGDETQSRHGT